jgi:predicted RNA methylase
MEYQTKTFAGVDVYYTRELDGGGAGYGQDFIPFIEKNLPRPRRVFEWCAGPGFIGFSILAHGLCDTLCLADINTAALDACRKTVAANGLSERVTVLRSDGLRDIPSSERWDLVVANPPHSGTDATIERIARPPILYQDPGWALHRAFYREVRRFLAAGAHVVVQENAMFSSPDTFREMISEAGLVLVGTPPCETTWNKCYYYVHTRAP